MNKPYHMTFRCECSAGLNALGSHFFVIYFIKYNQSPLLFHLQPQPLLCNLNKLRKKMRATMTIYLLTRKQRTKGGCYLLKCRQLLTQGKEQSQWKSIIRKWTFSNNDKHSYEALNILFWLFLCRDVIDDKCMRTSQFIDNGRLVGRIL